MPYADPEKARAAKRKSAMKRYWQNPSKARESRRRFPATCAVCGVEFLGRAATTRTCSRSCSAKLAHQEGRANTIAGTGPKNPAWRGGKMTRGGYVMVWVPQGTPGRQKNGYMMEHRLVMQEHIGRPLEPSEIVHHRNGVKDDNQIANLEIVTRAQHGGTVVCPHCRKAFTIN